MGIIRSDGIKRSVWKRNRVFYSSRTWAGVVTSTRSLLADDRRVADTYAMKRRSREQAPNQPETEWAYTELLCDGLRLWFWAARTCFYINPAGCEAFGPRAKVKRSCWQSSISTWYLAASLTAVSTFACIAVDTFLDPIYASGRRALKKKTSVWFCFPPGQLKFDIALLWIGLPDDCGLF